MFKVMQPLRKLRNTRKWMAFSSGSTKRDLRAAVVIAEIPPRFDVVAIQEGIGNLRALYVVLKYLGDRS
jgi:hypothetical protein